MYSRNCCRACANRIFHSADSAYAACRLCLIYLDSFVRASAWLRMLLTSNTSAINSILPAATNFVQAPLHYLNVRRKQTFWDYTDKWRPSTLASVHKLLPLWPPIRPGERVWRHSAKRLVCRWRYCCYCHRHRCRCRSRCFSANWKLSVSAYIVQFTSHELLPSSVLGCGWRVDGMLLPSLLIQSYLSSRHRMLCASIPLLSAQIFVFWVCCSICQLTASGLLRQGLYREPACMFVFTAKL